MCGIAGVVGGDFDNNHHAIRAMTESLIHRGPDASGYYIHDDVALGHTRLAVIDLSENANQPFSSSDGRYTLVYNGEIYNFRQIRKKISEHRFRTDSDTEVVLAAYIKWGVGCLKLFNGMFAIGIWDAQKKELFLARDRLGIKPLYFSNEEPFVFSSEIKAILKSGFVARKVNGEHLGEFLTYQTINPPNTIIDDVKQVIPGHYLKYSDGRVKKHSYWISSQNFQLNTKGTNQIKSDIKELLFDSIERRMISDVPMGAFLSGGIDSSVVVGIMSRLSEKPVETISMIFEEKDFDESKYSRLIAKNFKTNHHEIKLDAQNLLNELPLALNRLDSPAGDFMNSYLISKWAKEAGLTVALSGVGGDELFAGYPIFSQYPKISHWMSWIKNSTFRWSLGPLIALFASTHKRERIKELMGQEKVCFESLYPIFRKIYTGNELKKISKGALSERSPIIKMLKGTLNQDEIPMMSRLSMAELATYTTNVLLRDIDKMSMAHSLEVRTPFLDHTLVEYVLNVQDEYKGPGGSKRLLVESLDGLVPQEITGKRKQGFTFPWEKWMQGELREFCAHQLDALENVKFFDMQSVGNNWKSFVAKEQRVHWSQVWLLVVLSFWMNKNIIE